MDLSLNEEQELIQSTAREFLEAKCTTSDVREMLDADAGYSETLWKEMAELGWMGTALPEEHGGMGYGFLDLCLLIEEMGRARLPSPFVPTVVLGALPIERFGTDEQKAEYLPAVAEGERILTYAVLEEGSGWGVDGLGCVARREGDDFVIDGTKVFVPYAGAADEMLVVAEDGEGGLTVLLVETGSGGVTIEPLEGVSSDSMGRVVLDGVRVGPDRVLGEAGRGRQVVERIEAWGSAARCAEMVGGAEKVLEVTLAYAREREQFGQAIGTFQAVQHHCADMAIDVLASRYITYEAVWTLAEGLEAGDVVSMAKSWTGGAYRRVCNRGHQIHGAIGYTEEDDLHLYLRHAIATDLAFGDAAHHREVVARGLGI